MFDCRACSRDFCQKLLNPGGSQSARRRSSVRITSKRNVATFAPRTSDKVSELVAIWSQYVHPRGRDFFQADDRLQETLSTIIKNLNASDDPVLGGSDCVYWFGPTSKETGTSEQQAILELAKPGQSSRSPTFVNRLLTFVFATDESFGRLMKLPKEPFKMSCGDQLCVNIKHISD